MNAKDFFIEYNHEHYNASYEQIENIVDDLDEFFDIMVDFAEEACQKQRDLWNEVLSEEIYEDTYCRILPMLHEKWVKIQIDGNKRIKLDK